jgi:membrane fusion protein (multidrug efflux system)
MKRILMLVSLGALLYQTSCTSKHEEEKEKEVNYLVTSPLQKDTPSQKNT